ncbi:MAG: hypothetical protein Q8L78_04405 [Coxiellaceae bacterium]|nr:hypothetical protein [Coxiellaceae bacterium]
MKKLLILTSLAITCSLLSGCYVQAAMAQAKSRNEMMKEKELYTHCLEQNPKNISACDGYKAAYIADADAYRATNSGLFATGLS